MWWGCDLEAKPQIDDDCTRQIWLFLCFLLWVLWWTQSIYDDVTRGEKRTGSQNKETLEIVLSMCGSLRIFVFCVWIKNTMGFLIIGFGLIALLCLFRGYFFLNYFFFMNPSMNLAVGLVYFILFWLQVELKFITKLATCSILVNFFCLTSLTTWAYSQAT